MNCASHPEVEERGRNYWNGQNARAEGKPRQLIDGRFSRDGRQDWFAGWDAEDRYRAPKPSTAQRQRFSEWAATTLALLDEKPPAELQATAGGGSGLAVLQPAAVARRA